MFLLKRNYYIKIQAKILEKVYERKYLIVYDAYFNRARRPEEIKIQLS